MSSTEGGPTTEATSVKALVLAVATMISGMIAAFHLNSKRYSSTSSSSGNTSGTTSTHSWGTLSGNASTLRQPQLLLLLLLVSTSTKGHTYGSHNWAMSMSVSVCNCLDDLVSTTSVNRDRTGTGDSIHRKDRGACPTLIHGAMLVFLHHPVISDRSRVRSVAVDLAPES